MKTIKIGDNVWNKIVQNGKFGETADDVLVRLLELNAETKSNNEAALPPNSDGGHAHAWKERRASVRMTQDVIHGELILRFDTGQFEKWPLPAMDDHKAIRSLRDNAVKFVRKNGGTIGQEHAAIRALTSRGYHVAPRSPKSSFD
jgi:predicted CopG family antitoxin